MKFFRTVKDSIYNPAFYQNLRNVRTRESIAYYFKLVVLLSVISVIPFIIFFYKTLKPELAANVANAYPSDLVMTIKNGTLTTNVTEPYKLIIASDNEKTVSAIIDTKSEFSPTQFDEFKTDILVKKNFVVFRDAREVKMYSFANVKDLTIDRAHIETWLNSLRSIVRTLIPIFALVIYIGFIIFYAFWLAYLFVVALIIMLITYLTKKNYTYMQSYHVGIHAVTLSLIVQVVSIVFLTLANIHLPPYTLTLITLAVVILNFVRMPQESIQPINTI